MKLLRTIIMGAVLGLLLSSSAYSWGVVGLGSGAVSTPTDYTVLAKGFWSFENNLNDTSGNGENLTIDYGTAAYSESNACAGTYSANQGTVWSAKRAGTDLSADFPGRANVSAVTVVAKWYTGAGSLSSTSFYFYNHFYPGDFVSMYRLGIFNGKAYFTSGATTIVTGDTTLSENTSYVITGVWTGTVWQIWVNKSQDKTQVTAGLTGTGSTNYNAYCFYWPNTLPPRGYIDYVAVFDYALSESDIASIVDHCIDGSD